jgi:hypothetical protein
VSLAVARLGEDSVPSIDKAGTKDHDLSRSKSHFEENALYGNAESACDSAAVHLTGF